ncbi:hypothetical protein GPA19_01930 [Azoarcus indigens]|uniref:UPF0225 protein C7389_102181 n=1 Tax=Azoarcus indigens TaxID=29545 RepID=A0A4R6EDI7_9RHOO|nr:YchJ family protein [Azoarcus indigens]NMG63711.1 hypothetical protein [Azoarcus indigens]TDN56245.1 SEC-C motif-containing protein [Azoarcus indigens]
MKSLPCPCESGQPLSACCGPLIAGAQPAPTAERLMRSRYTAYAQRNADYLLATWHATTRPVTLDLDDSAPAKWIGLRILRHRDTAPNRAEVEFLARYRVGGRAHRLHENSRFVREDERWFYVDGDMLE